MTLSDEQLVAHLDAHTDKVVVLDATARGRVTWHAPAPPVRAVSWVTMARHRARNGEDVTRVANWLRSQNLIVPEQGHRLRDCPRTATEPTHRCLVITAKGADILDQLTKAQR